MYVAQYAGGLAIDPDAGQALDLIETQKWLGLVQVVGDTAFVSPSSRIDLKTRAYVTFKQPELINLLYEYTMLSRRPGDQFLVWRTGTGTEPAICSTTQTGEQVASTPLPASAPRALVAVWDGRAVLTGKDTVPWWNWRPGPIRRSPAMSPREPLFRGLIARLAGLLVCLTAWAPSMAQDKDTQTKPSTETGLSLNAVMERREYHTGDKLWIALTLHNKTEQERRLPRHLGVPEYSFVLIRKPNTRLELSKSGKRLYWAESYVPRVLGASETVITTAELSEMYEIPPGRYRIVARRRVGDMATDPLVESNAVDFDVLSAAVGPGGVEPKKTQAAEAKSQHTEWIAKSLREMQTIKPGMTRADLLKVFQEEGGLSGRTWRRYAYRGCPLIKVEVTFEPVGKPEDKPPESSKDKITKISKPFLEWAILD